ncbi:unnamed protein product [Paramecium sonneborni]|uniref:Uncharacterized protein n=1 Tax=Paramecium sonneborni TaxID=65129 RepID=A0A8S1R9U0_9CILI|nr:unnamed protein product [Paramecium sonneborni]
MINFQQFIEIGECYSSKEVIKILGKSIQKRKVQSQVIVEELIKYNNTTGETEYKRWNKGWIQKAKEVQQNYNNQKLSNKKQ